MVQFMRRYAAWIVWITVGMFGVTLLGGSAFYFGTSSPKPQATATPIDAVAMVGSTPLDVHKYREYLSVFAHQMNQRQFRKPTIEDTELARYQAFIQTVHYMLLLSEAADKKIRVSRHDIKASLEAIDQQYQLESRAELQELLEKNNLSYRTFVRKLKRDILVQKYVTQIQSSVLVNDQDIENQYVEIKAQHILIPISSSPTASRTEQAESEHEAYQQAKRVAEDLTRGARFADVAKQYSHDHKTKNRGGGLGWFGVGTMIKPFEQVAFSLDVGERSQPVKTPFGYHIIKVNDRRLKPRPNDFNFEHEKQRLKQIEQEKALQLVIQKALAKNALTIHDSALKAYQAKQDGRFEVAVTYYRKLLANSPNNPILLYLMAVAYDAMGQQDQAQLSLEKADIASEIDPQRGNPYVHLRLGGYYRDHQQTDDMAAQYDKALTLGKTDLTVLEQLEQLYRDMDNSKKLKVVLREIERVNDIITLSQESSDDGSGADSRP